MQLTLEQVTEMAPDGSSVAAGKKLMALKSWEEVGVSSVALWGLCRGSRTYQVKVDLSNLGYNCSCPSRKFPCKHVLGLLMLWAASPGAAAEGDPPDWVTEWLDRRRDKATKKADKQNAGDSPKKPVDEKARARRAAQREARVTDGLQRLDVWLRDLVRNGLGSLETKPDSFWEEQAKRLVDAQAPGLASRIARLADLPRSTTDWPERMLAELGRIKLLLHAWERIDQLDSHLQKDVRQILGWTPNQHELEQDGEQVSDSWAVVGQWVDDTDRVRAQRSWVIGTESRRTAVVLQFAPFGQAFAESIVPGTQQSGRLVFYPGAARQRGKFLSLEGDVKNIVERVPGAETIDEFLEGVAEQVARCPWTMSFSAVLHDVTIAPHHGRWIARDRNGDALQLRGRDHWRMLAITGGHPFDLTGEWNGQSLRPLGLFFEESFRVA